MAGVEGSATGQWRICGGRRFTPAPFLVAGIVNCTPDSFSDGGLYASPEAAFARAVQVVEEGADMVDLGAESTRPGATDIGAAEEMRRLLPVLEKVADFRRTRGEGGWFAISVDTFRAATAQAALERGADIINDISGGTFDSGMVEVVARGRPGYVLGHCPAKPAIMQREPRYKDVVEDIFLYFEERLRLFERAGLPQTYICCDPCLGFGKTLAHNITLAARASRFTVLGRPLYYGVSRKSFLGGATGASLEGRDTLTQVTVALLAQKGVGIHRVHQVAATRATLRLVQALS